MLQNKYADRKLKFNNINI